MKVAIKQFTAGLITSATAYNYLTTQIQQDKEYATQTLQAVKQTISPGIELENKVSFI